MGVVWLAHDLELEKDIALKFLAEHLTYDTSAISDLKKETRRGMELAHPNILRVYGFFTEDSFAAIAMEYVEGNPISALRSTRSDNSFDVEEIEAWTAQLCSALHYAHFQAEIVHRDLKPANLMVDLKNQLKIADFGIASSLNDALTRYTGATNTKGTLSYMSPQQLLGQRPYISHDIYSLGATLYDLLTGKPPFYSGDISLQIREVAPPSMTERRNELSLENHRPIPPHWEATIMACLEKEASLRPRSTEEVAAQLNLPTGGISFTGSLSVPPIPTMGTIPPAPVSTTTAETQVYTPPPTSNPPPSDSTLPVGSASTQPEATTQPTAPIVLESGKSNWILGLVISLALVSVLVGGGVAFYALNLAKQNQSGSLPANDALQASESPEAPGDRPSDDPRILSAEERERRQEFDSGELNRMPPPRQRSSSDQADSRSRPNMGPGSGLGMSRSAQTPGKPPPRGENPGPEPLPEFYNRPVEKHPFIIHDTGIELIWIPPGRWIHGAPPFENRAFENEHPATWITHNQGFWIGQREITQRQFQLIMDMNPSLYPQGPTYPIENISWHDAMEFCRRITQTEQAAGRLPEGYVYSLPTEFQWEYAAASGYQGKHGSISNYASAAWSANNLLDAPRAVGEKEPTAWNLYDVYGNVAEWTFSYYTDTLPGGRTEDYIGPAGGTLKVVKGGSFRDDKWNSRASVRVPYKPTEMAGTVGFRIALIPRSEQHNY